MTTEYERQLREIAKEEEALEKDLDELKEKTEILREYKETYNRMLVLRDAANAALKELNAKEIQLEKEKRIYLDVREEQSRSALESMSRESYDRMMSIFSDYDYQKEKKSIETFEQDEFCYASIKSENGVLLMEQYISKKLFS
jgi:hypothetical protein